MAYLKLTVHFILLFFFILYIYIDRFIQLIIILTMVKNPKSKKL